MRVELLSALLLFGPAPALGQGSLLQSGVPTAGQVPMYSGAGSQAVVQSSGPAGGGGVGLGLGELLQVNRTTTGTGPLGMHSCFYDRATTNSAGYHYLCLDSNARGGGLINYGYGGAAAPLPFQIIVNGTPMAFPTSTPSSPINPLLSPYNCVGDGVTDDTACMQAALTAAGYGTLQLDGTHKFLISTGLTLAVPVTILGTNGNLGVYSTSCPAGLITNSDIDLLTLTGGTATVRSLCFQMATAAGTRTAGAALKVGATPTTQQGHALIEENTVIFPYDGIMNGGATTGATQTNNNIISHNTIISPSNRGITNGASSTGVSTVDTGIRGNQIPCFSANAAAIAVALYDGAVSYDGNEGGPYNCNIGVAITPGTDQTVVGEFTGGLGDTSISQSLLIDNTASNGAVFSLRFSDWWAATNTNTAPGGSAILIRNTGGGANRVHGIIFTGGAAHGCNSGTGLNVIDLENDVYDITFVGNRISADCGQTNDTGIRNNSTGVGGNVYLTISGNSFVGNDGVLAVGFKNTAVADFINLSNNMWGNVTTPIVWTVGPPAHYVNAGNLP